MRNAILLHGVHESRDEYVNENYPSPSNDHWFPWLQRELMLRGISTQTPEVIDAYYPEYADYKRWENVFKSFMLDEDSILIGHSCGGGFLVRWLSENKVRVNKVILVAPWFDEERRRNGAFFDFTIDPKLQDRANEIHLLLSTNEEVEGIKETIDEIMNALPKAQLHKFDNMGHFTLGEMETNKFPELLDLVLK